MDWTDTKQQAQAIEDAIEREKRMRQNPAAGELGAFGHGILSGVTGGHFFNQPEAISEDAYSRYRANNPAAFRFGQGAGVAGATAAWWPFGATMGGLAVARDPAVKSGYQELIKALTRK